MRDHFRTAQHLMGVGRHAEAAGELTEHLSGAPDDSMAHAMLALCLTEVEDFDRATEAASRAIAAAPDSSLAHYALARVSFDRNDFKAARAAVTEAIRLDPGNETYHGIDAALHAQQRDWKAALAAADRGLEADPEDTTCRNLRAMALSGLGRKEEAALALDQVLSLDPEDSTTHANLGWRALEQRRAADALAHFDEALRLDPEDEWARDGLVESLKARYVVYRWVLAWGLWVGKLDGRVRLAVFIAPVIVLRALRGTSESVTWVRPVAIGASVLYGLLVFLSWFSNAIFTLLLFLHPKGRRVLARDERLEAISFAVIFAAALGCVVAALFTGVALGYFAALALGLAALPTLGSFSCPRGWPRLVMTGWAALSLTLALVGAVAAWTTTREGLAESLLGASGLLSMLSTWGHVYLATRVVRR